MTSSQTTIVDGRALARERLEQLAVRIQQQGSAPRLAVLLIGDDPASVKYVERKRKTGAEIGVEVVVHRLPVSATTEQIQTLISRLASAEQLDGLIVQLPLPTGQDTTAVIEAIPPALDVDCLTTANWRAIEHGQSVFVPPVAGGVLDILEHYGVDLTGKKVVLVGYGKLVGQPLQLLLQQQGVEAEVCTDATADLAAVVADADVVISGVGQPGLITGEMVKSGVVVIDVGSSLVNGKLKGDVDFDSVAPKAALITPTPGGVGPLTVVRLLENVVRGGHVAK